MWVYGDAAATVDPEAAYAALRRRLGHLPGERSIRRHQALAAGFVAAAELAQGLADARFEAAGADDGEIPLLPLLRALAGALDRSWRNGFESDGFDPAILPARLDAGIDAVTCKRAEGYAFYALYPESVLEAARQLPADRPLTVIGLRSIGLGLAVLAAAAAPAEEIEIVSLRPVGAPFARRLALAPALAKALGDPNRRYAVADEGPGLSGSSFGAVLDFLEARGVPRAHLHVLPSHAGAPGGAASEAHRARWPSLARHLVEFEPLLLDNPDPRHRLAAWTETLTGPALAPLQDLSGGKWRVLHFAEEAQYPPADPQQERRKYLLRSESGDWLLKFAGLGPYGEAKLARARMLAEAGFVPPLAGFVHGFTVERWLGAAKPLDPRRISRETLLARLGDYLGFRARHFPAAVDDGASLADLAAMLVRNVSLGLGEAAAERFRPWTARMELLSSRVRRIVTDNRLQPWEWLVGPDGVPVKTDALDHAAAHTLIGCQDVAWDIAGAAAEFGLDAAETEALCLRVEQTSGQAVARDLLAFLMPCHLAFELGAAVLARDGCAGWNPAEAARLDRQADRYRRRLAGDAPGDPVGPILSL